MGGNCNSFDLTCQAGEVVDSLLVFFANTMSTVSWMLISTAFTGNAGTIEDNEWSIATAMTSRWGLVLLIVVVALVLVQMLMSVASGNIRQAVSAFVAGLLSWPTTLVAVWLTVILTGATDRLTVGILGSGGEPSSSVIGRFFSGLEDLPLDAVAETGSKAFLVAAMTAITALASLLLSLMLAFRNFALICCGVAPVRESTRWMMDSLTGAIAFVRDQHQNMVAVNALGRAFYSPLLGEEGAGGRVPNLARFQFLDPASRDFYPDWERFAEMCVGIMRAEAGRDPHDPVMQELVGELSTCSPTFRRLWGAHDVRTHG